MAKDVPYDKKIFCYRCRNCKKDYAKDPWSRTGNSFCTEYADYVPPDAMDFIRTMGCGFYKVKPAERY